jgi:hypothetical protein
MSGDVGDRRRRAGADHALHCSAAFWRSSPIIVVFHVAFLVGGLLIQTLQGYHILGVRLYLRVLFGLRLLTTCSSPRWR